MKNNRPHPGPLPQERENRSPLLGETDTVGCRAFAGVNWLKAATARETLKLSERADSCSLSPGERVRVRASVHHTFPRSLRLAKSLMQNLLTGRIRLPVESAARQGK
jgi:hypothetical protein